MTPRKYIFTLVLWLVAGLSLLSTSPAFAQDPAPQPTPSADEVNRIAKNMYCPVCENVPLDVCESVACGKWREQIHAKLLEGWTDQQIYDFFVEQYGDRVLAVPPPRGLNWLVYIVPPVLFMGAVLVLVRVLRSSRAAADLKSVNSASDEPPDDAYIARIEEELNRRQ